MLLDSTSNTALRFFSWSLGSGFLPWDPLRIAPHLPLAWCPHTPASLWAAPLQENGERVNLLRKPVPLQLSVLNLGVSYKDEEMKNQ